jgi:hypothetical protein
MQPWSLVAIGCLAAAGSALLLGQSALVEARDLAAVYWFSTCAVSLRASFALAEVRGS